MNLTPDPLWSALVRVDSDICYLMCLFSLSWVQVSGKSNHFFSPPKKVPESLMTNANRGGEEERAGEEGRGGRVSKGTWRVKEGDE